MTEIPGLDLVRLRTYLDTNASQLSGDLTATLIPGGRSNLTYFVQAGECEYVLRRPPLGHVLKTAHDMAREYRVISALSENAIPVPKSLHLCQDESVIGAPFYLMSKVEGTVYRSKQDTSLLTESQAKKMSSNLIETLAQLHQVDPAAVGLGDFGRVDGFLERQVERWQKQFASSKSREIIGFDELATKLSKIIPTSTQTGVIHGDYRLDNCIMNSNLEVAAIVDWEMSTLGDCLSDLGLFAVYWDGILGLPDDPISGGINSKQGFPSAASLFNQYSLITGARLGRINWYIAFGFFKLAVILEGIHFRYSNGQTVGSGFNDLGTLVAPLVGAGIEALSSDGMGK